MNINVDNSINNIQPSRVESSSPVGYRLARKKNGDIVLQGAYYWQEGINGGHDWREIPTVDIE